VEHFDYITVPQSIWKPLYSWYSADWVISRKLVRDSLAGSLIDDEENCSKLVLELYPYSIGV